MAGIYSGKPIADTTVFDGARSRAGYRLNKLASSLTRPANRAAFLADEDGYMAGFGLDPDQRSLVRRRDWRGILAAGGNIYLMLKIAATVGSNLIAMGAEMRGESVADFLATRPGARARPWTD